MKKLILKADELNCPIGLKEFLYKNGLSKTLVKRVKHGGITLNGEIVTVRAEVKCGDTVEIDLGEAVSENIPPMDIPIEVVYEDDMLLAVNKPINMPTHPSRGNSLPTLANAVMARYGGDFVFRAVNRLDRDTSGLVLIAKDQMTANALSESMRRGRFKKKYIAEVVGVTPECGVIDAPIERECEGSIRRIVRPDGKRAVTEYRRISTDGATSLCEVTLHTGRTHQIRVHMAHIGHPLVNDFLYGERGNEPYRLTCVEIGFPHPRDGEEIYIRMAK